ncbi:hypothetical protein [Amycolatopsis sp. NPDC059657]|uniref:hypothetical protein n=1 Tax=Amycolatopsis sp. NPDC059657 TaxID=3346899 RepID=UPI00366EA630
MSDATILLTLGLLLERPMSPAELADTAVERTGSGPDAAEFATVTTRFRASGLTTAVGGADALTGEGKAEFERRVVALLSTPEPGTFFTAVGYLGALDRETAESALRVRVENLRAQEKQFADTPPDIPRLFVIENEYGAHACRAEREWIERTLAEIEAGDLTWPVVEVTEEGWQWEPVER